MPFMINILLFYTILDTFSPDLCNSKQPDTSEVFKQQQHSKSVNYCDLMQYPLQQQQEAHNKI